MPQRCFVAQHSGPEAFRKRRMFRQVDHDVVLAEFTFRFVAGAGDCVQGPSRKDFLHRHLVFRKGAGLVGANDRGAAEGFDRREFADDCLTSGHAGDADCEADGHGGRQALRDGPHRECDGGHEHVGWLRPAGDSQKKSGHGQSDNHPQHPFAELGDLAGQRGGQFNCVRY